MSVDTARHWVKTGRLDVMEKTRGNELVMVKVHVFIAKQMAGSMLAPQLKLAS